AELARAMPSGHARITHLQIRQLEPLHRQSGISPPHALFHERYSLHRAGLPLHLLRCGRTRPWHPRTRDVETCIRSATPVTSAGARSANAHHTHEKGSLAAPSLFRTADASALVDRHVDPVFRAAVVRAGADDLAVLALLDHVRAPAGGARDHEQRRE